jgi:hypothetical protein
LLAFSLGPQVFLGPEEEPELPDDEVEVGLDPEPVLVDEGVESPGAAVPANLETAGPGNW